MLSTVLAILVGLMVLVILVVVHELGHAIVARRNGVVVEEFGIGFPPAAWSRKLKNGVLFSLNWVPLGGFVKLQGEHDSASGKGDYGAASFWAKTKILLAGVGINFAVAASLLTILAWVGLPKIIPNQVVLPFDAKERRGSVQIAGVTTGSPAEKVGLRAGDEILRIGQQNIIDSEQVPVLTKQNQGRTIELGYKRNGQTRTVEVRLNGEDLGEGYLGASVAQDTKTSYTWSAPIAGVATTAQLSWETLKGVGQTLSRLVVGLASQLSADQAIRQKGGGQIDAAGASVAGPVGIIGVIVPAAVKAGPEALLLLMAVISLTLAVMNLLPIPALDGGRWFTTAVFRIMHKPLTKDLEEKINTAGFMFLMSLVVLVTFADVAKII